MSKYTPGPWRVSAWGQIETEKQGDRIVSERETAIMGMANANLIAAAPDLLEASKKLFNEISGVMGIVELRPLIGNTNFEVLRQRWEEMRAVIEKAEGAK